MLPKFDFKISSLESELHTRLAHCDEALSRITAVNKPALLKFDPLVLPLQFAWHQLQRFIAPVRHLHAVANTPELRIVYDKCLNTLTAYETELSQNEALYDAYQSLCENPSYAELSKVQQRLIEETLKDFKLSGVHLALEKKARLKAIHLRLAELSTQFEHNVMDASDRFVFHTDNLSDLMGLPPAVLSAAAEKAKQKNMTGRAMVPSSKRQRVCKSSIQAPPRL